MSTFVDFTPSTISAFAFQATLNGVQYTVTVTWNVFGQRYYINVTDLSGNLIICRSLVSSGPSLLGSLTWLSGVAMAGTSVPHNVPVGSVATARVISGTGFDGIYQMLATTPNTLTYALAVNPNESQPISGNVSFDLDLLSGLGIGSMYFRDDTQQFEIPS